ncbi:MAG: hybrid sensor histidine kinase/response regulator [Pseudomonadales bacterium]
MSFTQINIQRLKVSPIKGLKSLINRLSVGQKVMTVIIIEVISYSMITTIALSQIQLVGLEVKQMADLYLPLFSSTERIRQQTQEGRLNLMEIISVGGRVVYDKGAEEKYIAARDRYLHGEKEISTKIFWAENLIKQSIIPSTERTGVISEYSDSLLYHLSQVRNIDSIYRKRVARVFRHIEDGSFLMGMEMLSDVRASEINLTGQLDSLIAELEKVKGASVEYAERVERAASRYTIFASFFTVCVVIFLVLIVVRRTISKPLHQLTDTINAFNPLVKIEGASSLENLMLRGDELGRVSRSFNRLERELWEQGQDLQVAKEDAEKANRAKTMFLATASHDLRQPLHAMQMYIAALRSKVNDEDALKIIDDVDAVSGSTARLLSALLDVSRLEAGDIKPHFENFPVRDILLRVLRGFKPRAAQKELSFKIVCSDAIVRSDPVLLERIVGNFVSNALRYTSRGGVLVGCRRKGDKISIEVFDTGCGFPDEQAKAIFEDFHQLDNKERDRGKGLGLGLAIVKRLSESLSHQIECDSVVGKGSRFAVQLDRGTLTRKAGKEEDVFENIVCALNNVRVLLIEDDLEVQKATQQLLTSWGCTVYSGCNLEEVMNLIEEIKTTPPDIIIADNRLPGVIEGVEVAARVQLIIGRPIPVIVVTGDATDEKLRKNSGQRYKLLLKPVKPAKLRALITHLTGPDYHAAFILDEGS